MNWRTGLLAGIIAATIVAVVITPTVDGTAVRASRVAVVLAPGLTWDCLGGPLTPAFAELVDRAAVGSLSMQTAGGDTSAVAVAATIGAGARTRDIAGGAGMLAVSADGPGGRRVDPLRWSQLVEQADDARYGAVPGALGSSVPVTLIETGAGDAAAAGVAADRSGNVTGPGSTSATPEALRAALSATATPVAVVALAAPVATGCAARLAAWDPLVAEVSRRYASSSDMVVLVTSTTPLEPRRLGVALVAGRDPGSGQLLAGSLASASTNAARFVTLIDIAPTVLRSLGRDVPDEMTGQLMTVIRGAPDRDAAVRDGERAVVRDSAFPYVVAAWAALAVFILVGSFAVTRRSMARLPVELACLWSMSLPLASFLVAPLNWQDQGAVGLWIAAVVGAAIIAALAWQLARRRKWVGVVGIMTATWLVLAAFGNVVQMSAIFGYSPIDGGRFAGYGNQAFLLLGWSTLVICAVGDLGDRRRSGDRRGVGLGSGRAAMAALLAASVVIDGFIGSDVGGLLSMIPTAIVAWCVFTGRRVRIRAVVIAAGAAVAAVAVAAMIDLSRPAAERTHIGRLADRLLHGSGRDVLERKVLTLASTFVQLWAPVMLVAVGFFIWRLVSPSPRSRAIEAADPTLRPFGIAALTFVVLSALTNDSGLRMTAALVGLGVAHAAWTTVTRGGAEVRP